LRMATRLCLFVALLVAFGISRHLSYSLASQFVAPVLYGVTLPLAMYVLLCPYGVVLVLSAVGLAFFVSAIMFLQPKSTLIIPLSIASIACYLLCIPYLLFLRKKAADIPKEQSRP